VAEGCPVHLVSAGATAWIFTIAATCGSIRRTARTGVVDRDAELNSIVDPAEPADNVMARNEEADRIARAARPFQEQSMAIRPSFFEERPHPEIADVPGIRVGRQNAADRIAGSLKVARMLLCLVAMSGDFRMNGFFGRLISPFIRL
jgi:hypothetical protein